MRTNSNWGGFEKLGGIEFTERDFCETLDGGQAFVWNKADCPNFAAAYEGVFKKLAVRLALDVSGNVFYSLPQDALAPAKSAAESEIKKYLDADTDYESIRRSLAQTGDKNIAAALGIWRTLRILRQTPEEAIVGFICSSSKRIVQIKQCVGLLSEKFGEYVGGGRHALPSLEVLADAPEAAICECKLGFRARYLKKTAEKIRADKFAPDSLREIPYPEAKKYLTSLHGIGDKVADCILLFGAARFEAFPVDTWIKQAMTNLYNTPPSPDKIRDFAARRFGANAGFAQQLIFGAIRKNLL